MPTWLLIPVVLTVAPMTASILGAVLLDSLVRRPPGSGSITTLLPGLVYANATVLKVACLAGLVGAIVAAFRRGSGRVPWATLSVAAPALANLGGAIIAVAPSLFTHPPLSTFDLISRAAVFSMLGILIAGAGAAGLSVALRERPAVIAMLGLLVNGVLIALFLHNRFFALGFDQDLWAPAAR